MEDVLPFLHQEALHALAQKAFEEEKMDALESIAPFAEAKVIDQIVTSLYYKNHNFESVEDLMPFMHPEAVDALAMQAVEAGNFQDLDIIAPFMRQETIDNIIDQMASLNMDTKDLSPFASETIHEKKDRNKSYSYTLDNLPSNIDRDEIENLLRNAREIVERLNPKK